jgi:DNA-binding transcriptional ArsR family regulator
MIIGQIVEAPPVQVAAGSGLALPVALAAAASRPRRELAGELARALDEVGDTAGETWLNLLGVSLDAGAPCTAERLIEHARDLDPVDLRRHLLGRYAWSWCTVVGAETIDAAAAGDHSAFPPLLEHPRYYAGRARESLSLLLPLEPAETQSRMVAALEAGAAHLLGPGLDERISSAASAAEAVTVLADPVEAIERVTGGYRYVPEPEAERVLLIPHAEPSPSLVLAQHRGARLVVYSAFQAGAEERLGAIGRALADPKRVEILGLLGKETARVSDLVRATGLSRSTVHHHLGALREAGLVDLEGNARAYRYLPRGNAVSEVAALLEQVLRP